jgi:hypothetical protein
MKTDRNAPGSSWIAAASRQRRGATSAEAQTHLKRLRTEITKGFKQAKIEREQKSERRLASKTAKIEKCAGCGLWVPASEQGRTRHERKTGCKGATSPAANRRPETTTPNRKEKPVKIFKIQAEDDTVYIQAENEQAARERLKEVCGPIPNSMLKIEETDKLPEGEEFGNNILAESNSRLENGGRR